MVRPLSAIQPGKGARVKNKSSKTDRQREYLIAREYWFRRVLADRRLPQRAKIVAGVLYLHFNYEEFEKDGGLWAWPGLRSLDRATGQSKNTVLFAIEDLEAAGYLKPHHRYDSERRRYKSHLYEALTPPKVHKLNQGGSPVCTRVVHPGGTDSMNDSMNKDTTVADAPVALASLAKGEFEEESASPPSASSSRAEPSERASNSKSPDKPYTERDIEIVRGAIEDRGMTDVVAIVGYARGEGRWLSSKIIESMCCDGLFPALNGEPPPSVCDG